jgi:hypothetical protein
MIFPSWEDAVIRIIVSNVLEELGLLPEGKDIQGRLIFSFDGVMR